MTPPLFPPSPHHDVMLHNNTKLRCCVGKSIHYPPDNHQGRGIVTTATRMLLVAAPSPPPQCLLGTQRSVREGHRPVTTATRMCLGSGPRPLCLPFPLPCQSSRDRQVYGGGGGLLEGLASTNSSGERSQLPL